MYAAMPLRFDSTSDIACFLVPGFDSQTWAAKCTFGGPAKVLKTMTLLRIGDWVALLGFQHSKQWQSCKPPEPFEKRNGHAAAGIPLSRGEID